MAKALIALLILAACAAGLYAFVRRGFSTRTEPSRIESSIATTLREWSIPAKYEGLPNPVSCSEAVFTQAQVHWADHCATCHANNGSGDSMMGRLMYPKPPDMRRPETQHASDGELYYTIKNGVRLSGMPAFGEPGDEDADSWKLVCFIRRLPALTAQEERDMKKLNPKTPDDLEEERQEEQFLNGGAPPPEHTEHHHH
jgi:mono/diheme cytochrome c family protein